MKHTETKKLKNITTTRGKIWRAISNPWWLGGFILRKLSPFIKNDKTFIKWEYYFGMKKFPNLINPITFNDKLQWMKLNDRNPLYTRLVDKAEAKEYVSEKLGNLDHIIPTLAVWNKFEDIDFSVLPNQFVLKTTHDSGGVVIIKDKKNFNIDGARKKIEKSLNHSFFLEHREWPYLNVKPRIIAETYMEDPESKDLKDYKFFCFNGKVKMLFVATDRPVDTRFDFFDREFKHLPFFQGHPQSSKPISKPQNYEEMIRIAECLAKDFHQVRIDLYNIDGQIYFGEMTFFHFSGNVPFYPSEWDKKIGDWWHLPEIPHI